ncbi:MAG: pyridoxal phosphate-dependent aminotransferase [Pseudomonadota bacterium]
MIKISKIAANMKSSATLDVAAKAKKMRAQGKDVISFATGEPDFDTPLAIREAGKQAIDQGLTRYTPSSGIPELKAAVRDKLARDNSLEYEEDEITITCGAKHAIYNALQAIVDPGDEVIVVAPYWVSYPEQVRLAGGTPVIVETDAQNAFRTSALEIENAITKRTAAIILNYPSNPAGSTYSKEELAELGEVLVKHKVAIISDEIYEKLIFGESKHVSIAKACPACKDFTIVVNGVSKSYAMTGWRMGWACGPSNVISKMSTLCGQQISGIPAFVQRACIEALEGPQDEVKRMRDEFARRRDIMFEKLKIIPGIKCHLPDGTFYLFPNMSHYMGKSYGDRKIADANELAQYLLDDAHIATVSGEPFGAPNHVRLSFATSRERIEEGMARLANSLAKVRS